MKTHWGCAALLLAWTVSPADAMVRKGTLESFIASGEPQECRYEKQDGKGSQEITYYFAQKKMRADFKLTWPGKETHISHTINDGEWIYNWGGPGGEKAGHKMTVEENRKLTPHRRSKAPAEGSQPLEIDCKHWTFDRAMFTAPQDVVFSETTTDAIQQRVADMQNQNRAKIKEAVCAKCQEKPAGEKRDRCMKVCESM